MLMARRPGIDLALVVHSSAICCLLIVSAAASAEEPEPGSAGGGDAAAEMARKLQDPLANIKAIMTDNAIGFDTGNDGGTSFGFQLQPIYAINFPDRGFTLIPRAIIPIVGLEPGTDVRLVGDPTSPGSNRVWGLGDSIVQLFYAPHTEGGWKWGIGPQISLATATDDDLKGPPTDPMRETSAAEFAWLKHPVGL